MSLLRKPTRRAFLAGAAASLGLAGCQSSASPSGEHRGRTLTMFVYSGLDKIFEEYFVKPFQAETGATVILEAGWWDAIGKLKASPPGQPAYDLVLTDATQGYPAIKAGMFRTIDFSRIPNLKHVAPAVLDNWVAKERYGVTFPESAMSLVYDRRRANPPTGWGDLLRDDYQGQLALYNAFYMSLYTFACMKVAAEGRPGTAHEAMMQDTGAILDFARRERKRVTLWWPTGTRMLQDLGQGSFAAGNGHSVSVLGAVKEKPEVIGFTTPETDRAYVQLMWTIPAESPQADLAELAIDYLFRRETQVAFARRGGGTPHEDAARIVAAEDPLWAQSCPSTPEQFRTLRYFPYEAYFKDWSGIARVWDEEVLRSS